MKNYRSQDGCHNCVFRMEESDYDSPISYFCNADKSITINEFYESIYIMSENKYKRLRQWQAEHSVEDFGICDLFSKEDAREENMV